MTTDRIGGKNPFSSWLRWMPLALALAAFPAGCGGDEGGDGGDGSGGLIGSCQNMMTEGVVLTCDEHYGDASIAMSVGVTYKSVCDAQSAVWSKSHCPTTNLLGSCKITAAGATAYGLYDVLFIYATPNTSAATAAQSCTAEGGTFQPGT